MTGRTLRRRRTVPNASTIKTKKRKNPRRRAKKEENLGVCEINGAKGCDDKKKVPLVTFDSCRCKRMCMACARKWLEQSSTCPFCRAQVALVNNIDVEYKRQREDHDIEVKSFSFPYLDWLGQPSIFQAHIETSRLFANKRAAYKLPNELLFMIKTIEQFDIDIVHDEAFFAFAVRKLANFKGKRQQAMFRILFYFAMHERNQVAFFFLMTIFRKRLQCKQNGLPYLFDIKDSSDLRYSKGIFLNVPDPCLFNDSALEIYKRSTETHFWHLLCPILCLMFPDDAFELRIGSIEPPSEEDSEEEFYGQLDTTVLFTVVENDTPDTEEQAPTPPPVVDRSTRI